MTKNITVTPQPKWIQVDVKEEVFRDNGWVDGTLSVEDPKVTETVLAGFRVHPWVKKVLFVVKRPPAAIDVQIEYRKPVATVMTFANGKNGLLTVDDEGVLLSPWEVFRPLVHKLPVIDAPGSDPSDLNAGQPWGDKRIIAGAQIAEMIGLEKWGEYGLYKIEARWPDDFRKQQNDPEFVLSSQSGNEVIWGRFPTPKQPQTGEPTPKRKLAMLAAAVKQNGSLANKKQAAPVDLRRDGG